MSAVDESADFRVASLQGRLTWLDLGSNPARIDIYASPRPDPGAPAVGALLVSAPLLKPCCEFDGPVLAVRLTALALITSSGEAVWARWFNGEGVWAMDTAVGAEGSGAPVELSSTTLYQGGRVQVLGGTLG